MDAFLPTGGDGLTHVAKSVQTSLDMLVKYGITVDDQPDEERFVILFLAGMAEHSPPGQHAVFRLVRGSVRHSFGSSPDLPLDAKGLLAGVSRLAVPFVHPWSCQRLEQSSSTAALWHTWHYCVLRR